MPGLPHTARTCRARRPDRRCATCRTTAAPGSPDLRTRALALDVAEKDDGGALAVTVTVANVTAGHTVPAGLPERRIVVRVHVLDAAGAELESQTRALGRVLVDASGAEVPFWTATKVGSDTRIAPGADWHETFAFHPASAGTVEVEVLYRSRCPSRSPSSSASPRSTSSR